MIWQQTPEGRENDVLRNQLRELTPSCEQISLANFTAGDMRMLLYCNGALHGYSPTNAELRKWIARMEEIARRE